MRTVVAIIVFFALCGCARRIYVPVETIRTVDRRVVDTVVKTIIEREEVKNKTRDTVSHLETKVAESTASISDGVLSHDLRTKQDSIPVKVVYVQTHTVDTVPAPYPVYVDKIVEKPTRMPLRWWERALIYLGGASLGLAVFRMRKLF